MQARAASPLRRGPAPGEALRRGLVPGNARPRRAPATSSRAAPTSRALSSPAQRAPRPLRQHDAGLPCPTSPIEPIHSTSSALAGGTTGANQWGSRNSHVAQSLPLAVVGELVGIAAAGGTAASSGVSPAHLGHLTISAAALTQLSLTAVAVAYGAYLSDGLLRQQGQATQPEPLVFHGVDVTEYEVFRTPEVQRAVEYAAMAHRGQTRRTGDPYVTHCIHTARIAAGLAPGTSKRAIETVVAAVLHDVVDDTGHTLADVEEEFGGEVARLVDGVSRLSYINQLLRRHRRTTAEQQDRENTGLSPEDVDSLRLMLIGMINDPRVVLVKLADRLHNMRTIYALPEAKARAVAQETLSIWCSLASRLGVWAIKAELEDLCFAILQPHIFRKIRGELASMWSSPEDWRSFRRRTRLRRYTSTRGIPPAPATQGQPASAGTTAGERVPSSPLLLSPSPSAPASSSPEPSQPLLSAASAAAAELIRDFSPFRTPTSSSTFPTLSSLSSSSSSSSSDEGETREGEGWRGWGSAWGGQGGTPGASAGPQAGVEYTVQDLVESVIPFHVLLNKTYRHTGSFWPSEIPRTTPGEAYSSERESTPSADETRLETADSTVSTVTDPKTAATSGASKGIVVARATAQLAEPNPEQAADQAVLRALHNVPTLPQLALPSADSRGSGGSGVLRRYTGMQADSLAGEYREGEGAVREGQAGAEEGWSRRAKTRVMLDAEVALGALRKCEEQLQRELLLTTPYVPGMEISLSGRLKSIYSCHSKMRRKGVGLDKIYDARALRVVVGDGGGRFQEAAVEACYNLLSVVHRLWTPIGGEFDDYILNPKPSGYQSLHTAVVGPDGAPLEVQIRTQMMHESAEFGHAAHWLYKESDMPPEAHASAGNETPAAEPVAGSGTPPSAVVTEHVSPAGESVSGTASAPSAAVDDPNSAAGFHRSVEGLTGGAGAAELTAVGLRGGVSQSPLPVPAEQELQRMEATSQGGPRVEAGGGQAPVQGSTGYGDRGVIVAQHKSGYSDSSVTGEAGSARGPATGEEAGGEGGQSPGSAEAFPGASQQEWLRSSVREDPYRLLLRKMQPLSGTEREQSPDGAAGGEGTGETKAAGAEEEEASSSDAGKLPTGRGWGGWGYRGTAAPPWEEQYGSEAEDNGGPLVYPGGSRPSKRLLQYSVPGSEGKLVMEGHPALRVAEGRLLSSVVMKVEAGGTSLLVAVSFALRAREAVSRGMRGTSAPGGGASGDGGNKGGQGVQGRQWAQWERWEGYVRLFDKVDSTWWNAPGHGDWSTCLEQYELCSDGIYHKVDRFGRVLPTFIQLLDLSEGDVQDYQATLDAVRQGGVLVTPARTPAGQSPAGGALAGNVPSGDLSEGSAGVGAAWRGARAQGGGGAQGMGGAMQQMLEGESGRTREEGGEEGREGGSGVPTVEGRELRSSSMGQGGLGQQPEGGRGGGEEGDALNLTARINNKVRLLRSMLQWERELRHEAAPDGTLSSLEDEGEGGGAAEMEGMGTAVALTEVLVVRWPGGDIVRLPGGSCAEAFVELEERREGGRAMGKGLCTGGAPVVLVNGRPADLKTPLQDGDLVEIRQKVEAKAQ